MARFRDKIGFDGPEEQLVKGQITSKTVERVYSGDVLKDVHTITEGGAPNGGLSFNHRFSVVMDQYLESNWATVRYVKWQGLKLKVVAVTIERPRAILQIGGIYNDRNDY